MEEEALFIGQGGAIPPPVLLRYRSSSRFILAVVCLAFFTEGFLFAVVVPVFPFALVENSGVSEDGIQLWTSLLLAIFGFAALVICPISAWLVSRFASRRLPLLGGLVFQAASVCLFIEDLPVWAFMTARAFQGTSAAVVCNLGLALLVDTFGLHIAGEKLGYALSSATFGVISSSLLGGLLYEHAGYHAVVGMILGLVGINLVVRLLVIEKKLAQTWKGSDVSEGKASEAWYPNGQGTTEVGGGLQAYSEPFPRPRFGGVGSALDGTRIACESDRLLPTSNSCRAKESSKPLILHLVKEPRILADTYAVFTVNVLFASFDSNLGIFVKKRFGWGPICVGAIYLTIAVPPLLSPVTNSLSRKFGARWIAAGGFVASSGFTTLLSLVSTDDVPHAVALCVLMTIIGFALTFSVCPMASDLTNGIEAVGREQKHTSGETAAFVQAFSILLWASAAGTVVGPLFTGFAGDLLGWGNMNICLGAFALTGVVAVVFFKKDNEDNSRRIESGEEA